MTIRCPYCAGELRSVVYPVQKKTTSRKNLFESVQSMPPAHYNGLRKFLWFFNPNNHYNPRKPDRKNYLELRYEYRPTPTQILITELEIPATEDELRQLADLYVRRGEQWSRSATERYTTMGQGRHNNIKDAFLKLGFLNRLSPTRYELAPPGLRFLRHYLT